LTPLEYSNNEEWHPSFVGIGADLLWVSQSRSLLVAIGLTILALDGLMIVEAVLLWPLVRAFPQATPAVNAKRD
jgi:hypothetical protein